MKKIILLLAFVAVSSISFGQAQKYLNLGFVGVSYEIPVAKDITVGPAAYTDWNFDYLTVGAKGNYYFDSLLELTEPWDVYAGANIGFGIAMNNGNDSEINFGLQVGGRWFWNEKWGVYVEIGGGALGGAAGVGVTMKM